MPKSIKNKKNRPKAARRPSGAVIGTSQNIFFQDGDSLIVNYLFSDIVFFYEATNLAMAAFDKLTERFNSEECDIAKRLRSTYSNANLDGFLQVHLPKKGLRAVEFDTTIAVRPSLSKTESDIRYRSLGGDWITYEFQTDVALVSPWANKIIEGLVDAPRGVCRMTLRRVRICTDF